MGVAVLQYRDLVNYLLEGEMVVPMVPVEDFTLLEDNRDKIEECLFKHLTVKHKN